MARSSTSGQGRPKGVPNKFSTAVREAFAEAFVQLQADPDANLVAWAKTNRTEFYKLAQRFVPAEINAHVQGALTVVTGVPDEPDEPPADGSDLV